MPDIVASIPLGWTETTGSGAIKANKLLRMLRLFKLLRLAKVRYIRKWYATGGRYVKSMSGLSYLRVKYNPALLRFAKALVVMVVAWHFVACLYWYVDEISLRFSYSRSTINSL